MLNPRELLALVAVTAELAGEGCWLVWSSSSTDVPSGSVCALRATTYSYVVIPCGHKSDIKGVFPCALSVESRNSATWCKKKYIRNLSDQNDMEKEKFPKRYQSQ